MASKKKPKAAPRARKARALPHVPASKPETKAEAAARIKAEKAKAKDEAGEFLPAVKGDAKKKRIPKEKFEAPPKPEPFKPACRMDFNRHVALEYHRGDKWSEYLAHTPAGVQKFREPSVFFLKKYDAVMNQPLGRSALAFLRGIKSAYSPDPGAASILLEIITMDETQGSTDKAKLDLKGLVSLHNKLAEALGKGPVKNFKSKAEALARIEKLETEAKTPTPVQEKTAEDNRIKAAKRLAPLNAAPTPDKENDMAAKKTSKTSKKTAGKKTAAKKPAAKKAAGGTKRPGIGAFCMEMIEKGKTNEQILAAVKSKFPDASTSAASVAWYRNKLKNG